MRALLLIAAAAALSGCLHVPPSAEPVVNAVGAGVDESFTRPSTAVAQPTTNAAGAGTEILAIPATAEAKAKRK